MFTGLIADLGTVTTLAREDAGARIVVGTRLGESLSQGDSIAVNGVCLTATRVRADGFEAQAMTETLARSALGELEPGTPVNLELALRADDRLGGHIVQGHVDATGMVRAISAQGFARTMEIECEARLQHYLVEKGSVAVDGVSLTVSALLHDGFAVSLIPETLERTNLGTLREGARVNIEVDILAKHVERLLEASGALAGRMEATA
jgi:riboflavin synthase